MKVLLGIRSFSPPKDVCGQLIRQARERLSTAFPSPIQRLTTALGSMGKQRSLFAQSALGISVVEIPGLCASLYATPS